jgi:hypothetical protein
MFFETISMSSGELNTAGALLLKQTVDLDPTAYQGYGDYRPSKIYVQNKSGVDAYYGLMTSKEYTLYSGNLGYSSLKPISNNITDEYTNIRGEIIFVLASGTLAGGHTGNLNFYLVRD